MNLNSRKLRLPALVMTAAAILLSGCGEQSKWQSLYKEGQKCELAGDVDGAVKKYRAAVEDGYMHNVDDKQFYGAILASGNLLVQQGKDGDAIPYLVRALQLGTAVKMSLEQNIKLLHALARAEASIKDWEEAAGTERTLITLLEVEKGPWTPALAEERRFNQEVTTQLIAYRKANPPKPEEDEDAAAQNRRLSEGAVGTH